MTNVDAKQARIAERLKQMEADTQEAANAVVALAKVFADAPAAGGVDHAYLVRHSTAIEIAAKRVCKSIAGWRKHL